MSSTVPNPSHSALRGALAPVVPHPAPEERLARGKAARSDVPRSSHAAFEPAADRRDPVELLESQAPSRVPELVPIRYGRMLVSPFTFYRGAALVMAADLATTGNSGIKVQACGDAHLANFGVFASPERNLVFDVNDFDETLPAPWEWDVKRLCASLVVAARDREFTDAEQRAIAGAGANEYRVAMRNFAGTSNLEVWYSRLDVDRFMNEFVHPDLDPSSVKRAQKTIAKARTRDSMQALNKLTTVVDGTRRIVSDPPLIVPIEELFPDLEADTINRMMRGLVRTYRHSLQPDRRHLLEQFELLEVARKVVGVGSVGTRCYILLLQGRDETDPLFLQAKEAQPSVLEAFAGTSQYANQGQRVVAGQHLMQASSDIFLGWERAHGLDGQERDFYLRQLRDWKGSADLETMVPSGMELYARLCGWTLARAHARSGDRIAIGAYLGGGEVFDQAITDFSVAYADQNERDYARFEQAVAAGEITAQEGL
ncbi:MAG: DUF2252 domain-containing protein [Acidimicrobiia bacterium]